MTLQIINPESLGAPKGWNNGVLAPAGGRLLFIAGQAGWENDNPGTPPPFVEQFGRALDKIVTVVKAAGGQPGDVVRMTAFVTDLPAWRAGVKALRV